MTPGRPIEVARAIRPPDGRATVQKKYLVTLPPGERDHPDDLRRKGMPPAWCSPVPASSAGPASPTAARPS